MEITPEAKKRLSALIEKRDTPLAPLAAKIGVSQSTLWNFMYGETKNFSKIHRLATELKVSLDWILGGDQPVFSATGTGQSGFRASEHLAGQGFDGGDRMLLRDIAIVAAALARQYPKLKGDTIGAIALNLWGRVQTEKLSLGRGKAGLKTLTAEAQSLATYEMSKRAG